MKDQLSSPSAAAQAEKKNKQVGQMSTEPDDIRTRTSFLLCSLLLFRNVIVRWLQASLAPSASDRSTQLDAHLVSANSRYIQEQQEQQQVRQAHPKKKKKLGKVVFLWVAGGNYVYRQFFFSLSEKPYLSLKQHNYKTTHFELLFFF